MQAATSTGRSASSAGPEATEEVLVNHPVLGDRQLHARQGLRHAQQSLRPLDGHARPELRDPFRWTAATRPSAHTGSTATGRRPTPPPVLSTSSTGLAVVCPYSLGVAAVDNCQRQRGPWCVSATTSPCPVIAAAGDICELRDRSPPTAIFIRSIPDRVLAWSDNAYSSGSADHELLRPELGQAQGDGLPHAGRPHGVRPPARAGYSPSSTARCPVLLLSRRRRLAPVDLLGTATLSSASRDRAQEAWLKNDLATHATRAARFAYWRDPRLVVRRRPRRQQLLRARSWTDLYNGVRRPRPERARPRLRTLRPPKPAQPRHRPRHPRVRRRTAATARPSSRARRQQRDPTSASSNSLSTRPNDQARSPSPVPPSPTGKRQLPLTRRWVFR